jgi:hypothetical protein
VWRVIDPLHNPVILNEGKVRDLLYLAVTNRREAPINQAAANTFT